MGEGMNEQLYSGGDTRQKKAVQTPGSPVMLGIFEGRNSLAGIPRDTLWEIHQEAVSEATARWKRYLDGLKTTRYGATVRRMEEKEPEFFARFSEFQAYVKQIFIEMTLAKAVSAKLVELELNPDIAKGMGKEDAVKAFEFSCNMGREESREIVEALAKEIESILTKVRQAEYLGGHGKKRPTGQKPDAICIGTSHVDLTVPLSTGSEISQDGKACGGMLTITLRTGAEGLVAPLLYALNHTEELKAIVFIDAARNNDGEQEARDNAISGLRNLLALLKDEPRHGAIVNKIKEGKLVAYAAVYRIGSGATDVVAHVEHDSKGLAIIKMPQETGFQDWVESVKDRFTGPCRDMLDKQAMKMEIHTSRMGEPYREQMRERRDAEGTVGLGCMDKRHNLWKKDPVRRVIKTFGASIVTERDRQEIIKIMSNSKNVNFIISTHEGCGFAGTLKELDGRTWDGKSDIRFMAHGKEHVIETEIITEMLHTELLSFDGEKLRARQSEPKDIAMEMYARVQKIFRENEAAVGAARGQKPLQLEARYYDISSDSYVTLASTTLS